MSQANDENPLLERLTTPFEVPPFARIEPDHFRPAFADALTAHAAEIVAIAGQSAPPSFENTIAALERSGRTLARVSSVFYVLAGADTNDTLQAIEREHAPMLAAHWDRVHMNEVLFRRIAALHERVGELGLTAEQARVLERYHVTFRRAGAALDAKAKQ
ncbi:MAG TPA: hypothetical protein VKE42_13115, partial [Candidatus Cybelea sp.]|nr:hypothetical protein [Candidatus Cybelea sp.]